MPSTTSGFSWSEITSHVVSWIGNADSAFQTLVENFLPLAEFRFCKLYDWPFLHKQNLSLTVASGTQEYTLEAGTIGFFMAATDVKTIYSEANNRVLKKTSLDNLRRMDADNNEGTTSTDLMYWAPSGDNKIVLWPKLYNDTALKVDGKITPTPPLDLATYPTTPYRFQESLIKYTIGELLARENDTRAENIKAEALVQAQQDFQAARAELGDAADEPRFKHWAEASVTPVADDNDPLNMRVW